MGLTDLNGVGTEHVSGLSHGIWLLIVWLFPVPFIVMGVFLLIFGVKSVNRASKSVDWPRAIGVVREASVKYDGLGEGRGTYEAILRYEYDVDGTTHSGDSVDFGDYGSSNSSHAQGIVDRYPEGKEVVVYYMPENPDVCVLEPGLKLHVWFAPAGGLVFLVAGLLMAMAVPMLTKK